MVGNRAVDPCHRNQGQENVLDTGLATEANKGEIVEKVVVNLDVLVHNTVVVVQIDPTRLKGSEYWVSTDIDRISVSRMDDKPGWVGRQTRLDYKTRNVRHWC